MSTLAKTIISYYFDRLKGTNNERLFNKILYQITNLNLHQLNKMLAFTYITKEKITLKVTDIARSLTSVFSDTRLSVAIENRLHYFNAITQATRKHRCTIL